MRISAAATLELDISAELMYISELEDISEADVCHLQQYLKDCKKQAHDYYCVLVD